MYAIVFEASMADECWVSPRISGQLGLTQMITIEIKVPNRMVGLGKRFKMESTVCICLYSAASSNWTWRRNDQQTSVRVRCKDTGCSW